MPGEELNTFLQKTLGDNNNNLPQLVGKLEELGVETIEDLKFLEVADLSDVLKPVQCRKFIQAIQLEGSSGKFYYLANEHDYFYDKRIEKIS